MIYIANKQSRAKEQEEVSSSQNNARGLELFMWSRMRTELSCSRSEGGKNSSGKLIIFRWELPNRLAAILVVEEI